jgi:plasmid replication initiation protein
MDLQELPPDREILQHNAITSGRYEYSACQLDIIFMTLAMMEKDDSPDKIYTLYAKDIEAITGRQWQYNQLKEATQGMGSRMIEIDTPTTYTQMWLFRKVSYLKGKGRIEIKLNDEMRPYLFELKDNFTVMQLKAALSCSSKYAKRLYAISCQWRRRGGITMEISKLKEMLFLKDPKGKEKEQFTQIGQLREKVLDIAKQQINEHTDIRFDYELIKQGRSFEKIRLFVNIQMPKQGEINFHESIDLQKHINEVKAYGFPDEVAEKIARYSMPAFHDAVDQVKKRMAKEPVDKPGAYITTILKAQKLI